MFDAIGFNDASTLLSSISCTSGPTTTYFVPSGIYLPVILFTTDQTSKDECQ